jgi:Ca2+-binding RTX toxin-like protein
VRFDFVTNLHVDAGQATGFAWNNHVLTHTFTQNVSFVQGGATEYAAFTITAIKADNDQTLFGDADEVKVDLSTGDIKVFNGAVDVTASVTLTDLGDSIQVVGVHQGWTYQVSSADTFSAIQIEGINVAGADDREFKLGQFSYGENNAGLPIELTYEVLAKDGDGDPVTSEVNATLYPSTLTMLGTSGANTINGTSAANDILGLAGGDTINGQGGDDILVGGTGADSLTGSTGSDTFKFTDRMSADTVSDFGAGDVLNVHDVLPVAAHGADETTLGLYLKVEVDVPNNKTVISVDIDGTGSGAATQIVTLQNVQVTLADLLNNNQLIT